MSKSKVVNNLIKGVLVSSIIAGAGLTAKGIIDSRESTKIHNETQIKKEAYVDNVIKSEDFQNFCVEKCDDAYDTYKTTQTTESRQNLDNLLDVYGSNKENSEYYYSQKEELAKEFLETTNNSDTFQELDKAEEAADFDVVRNVISTTAFCGLTLCLAGALIDNKSNQKKPDENQENDNEQIDAGPDPEQ